MVHSQSTILDDAADALERDLPEMMECHPGFWVAYWGCFRLAIDPDPDELSVFCDMMGYLLEDLQICKIQPDMGPARVTW